MIDTSALIDRLAAEAPPVALRSGRMAALIAGTVALACALFLSIAGLRADLSTALAQAGVLPKTILPAALMLVALPLALATLRPGMHGPRLAWLFVPLAAAVILWGAAFLTMQPDQRFAEVTAIGMVECMGFILLLSAPPLAAALALFQQGAPLRPSLTGFLAGLSSASGAATGYSLFCTQDNPLFYLTWYGLATMLVGGIGAMTGKYWLRW